MVFGSSIFDRATELNLQNMTGTVRIVCGEPYTVFEVHRTLLRNASPFFRNHLATPTDAHSSTIPVIQIPPHYTARACHEYAKYLYGNTVLYNASFEVKLEAYLLAKFLGDRTPFLNACLRAIQSSPPSICQLAVPEDFFSFTDESDAARQFIMQHIARGILRGSEVSQNLDNHLPDSAWRRICLEITAEGKKARSHGNAPGQSLFGNPGLFGNPVTDANQGTCGLFGNTQNKPQGGLFGNFANNSTQTQQQGGLFSNSTPNAGQNQQQEKGGFGIAAPNRSQGLFASDNKAGGLFASKGNNTSTSQPFGTLTGNPFTKTAPYVSPFSTATRNSNERAQTSSCPGTHGVTFVPIVEPDSGYGGNNVAFQSISRMPFNQYSHEELRYTDYQTSQRPPQSLFACSTNCATGSQTNILGAANLGVTGDPISEAGAGASTFSTPCQILTPASSRDSSPGHATSAQGVPAQQTQQQQVPESAPQPFAHSSTPAKDSPQSASKPAANPLYGAFPPKPPTSSPFSQNAPSRPGFTLPQFGHAAQPINGINPTNHYCTPGCDHALRKSTESTTQTETNTRDTQSEQEIIDTISKLPKQPTDSAVQVDKASLQAETAVKDTAAGPTETDSMATYHETVKQLQSQLMASQKAVADLQAQLSVVKAPFEAARQGAAASSSSVTGFGSGAAFGNRTGAVDSTGFRSGAAFGTGTGSENGNGKGSGYPAE